MPAPTALANPGTLLHRQLFVALRQKILGGGLQAGDRLPTQEALCAQFAVSRITVRRALADLQAEGLIRNEQGVGAFVTASAPAPRPATSLSFVEELRRVVEQTSVEVVGIALARSPRAIADALGLERDADALHVVRIRRRDAVPVMLLEAWLPRRFQKLVTATALQRAPLFKLVTQGGKNLGSVVQEINAELADAFTAPALQVELNAPVLRINRLLHDKAQAPLQFLSVWSSPSRSRMLMEVAAKDVNTLSAGTLVHDLVP